MRRSSLVTWQCSQLARSKNLLFASATLLCSTLAGQSTELASQALSHIELSGQGQYEASSPSIQMSPLIPSRQSSRLFTPKEGLPSRRVPASSLPLAEGASRWAVLRPTWHQFKEFRKLPFLRQMSHIVPAASLACLPFPAQHDKLGTY